jgi:ABC-type oligopeptide transport system ATPase subunit
MAAPLLEAINATKVYGKGFRKPGTTVLKGVNLIVPDKPAKIIAIAGESGSGKTTLVQSVLGFIRLSSGQILYRGKDIAHLSKKEHFEYRRKVQAVFQDPYEVYNPFYPVRHIFDLVIHNFKLTRDKKEAREMIETALNVVGLRGNEVMEKYPHQLSGGQRQRMMIARAYMLRPEIIVADEPVSMVDASLRAVILNAMQRLRDDHGISFLYITHDLSTAYQICDEMYVLYHGEVVEKGSAVDIIERPTHPYVKQLIASIPVPDPDVSWNSAIVEQ